MEKDIDNYWVANIGVRAFARERDSDCYGINTFNNRSYTDGWI